MSLSPISQNDIKDIAKVFKGWSADIHFVFFATLFDTLEKSVDIDTQTKTMRITRTDSFSFFGRHLLTIKAVAETNLVLSDKIDYQHLAIDICYQSLDGNALDLECLQLLYREHFLQYAQVCKRRELENY